MNSTRIRWAWHVVCMGEKYITVAVEKCKGLLVRLAIGGKMILHCIVKM